MKKSLQHRPIACPYCGEALDAATEVDGDVPSSIDLGGGEHVSICLYCANVSIYTAGMLALRRPRPAELIEIKRVPMIKRILNYLKKNPFPRPKGRQRRLLN